MIIPLLSSLYPPPPPPCYPAVPNESQKKFFKVQSLFASHVHVHRDIESIIFIEYAYILKTKIQRDKTELGFLKNIPEGSLRYKIKIITKVLLQDLNL